MPHDEWITFLWTIKQDFILFYFTNRRAEAICSRNRGTEAHQYSLIITQSIDIEEENLFVFWSLFHCDFFFFVLKARWKLFWKIIEISRGSKFLRVILNIFMHFLSFFLCNYSKLEKITVFLLNDLFSSYISQDRACTHLNYYIWRF